MTRKDFVAIAQGLANARPVFKEGQDYATWFSCMAEIGCALSHSNPRFLYTAFREMAETAPRRYPGVTP